MSTGTRTPTAKLAVVSVHCDCELSPLWLRLQSQFLRDCTPVPYSYYVHANGTSPEPFAKIATGVTHSRRLLSHRDSLNALLGDLPPHDHVLILDSDCFPVDSDWYARLTPHLGWKQAVAAVRAENWDTFAHPCVLLCHGSTVPLLNPDYREWKNLAGEAVRDMSFDPSLSFRPLLRTNRVNAHPLLGAIYESFYHHGCGSRELRMRSIRLFKMSHDKIHARMLDALSADPWGFVRSLMFPPENHYIML